jgi:hypothetical protein
VSDRENIERIFAEAKNLCLAKNEDYASSIREVSDLAPDITPCDAILVRMGDKISRFRSLRAKGTAAVDETMRDTMLDLANYGLLWCMLK